MSTGSPPAADVASCSVSAPGAAARVTGIATPVEGSVSGDGDLSVGHGKPLGWLRAICSVILAPATMIRQLSRDARHRDARHAATAGQCSGQGRPFALSRSAVTERWYAGSSLAIASLI